MRKEYSYILLLVLLLLPSGCNKQNYEAGPKEAIVNIRTSIESTSPATKYHISGTTVNSYGIFVCEHNTTDTPHKSNSWNILAQYNSTAGEWQYYYVANLITGALSSSPTQNLTITERPDGHSADLYAYLPYRQDAFNKSPTRIPYSLPCSDVTWYDRDIQDLLYAVQNGSGNKDLDPTSGDPLEAVFTFRHAFALLVFNFSSLYSGSSHNIFRATISKNPDYTGVSIARLYASGTFNAITGTFNDDDAVNVQSFFSQAADWRTDITSPGVESPLYMMIVPTEFNDGELQVTFMLDGINTRPFIIRNVDVQHFDGTAGFQAGYVYNFHYTIENYVRFDGVTVSDDWAVVNLGSSDI